MANIKQSNDISVYNYMYQSTSKSFVEFAKNITELQVCKVKTRSGTRIVHIKPMVISNPVSVGYTIYGFGHQILNASTSL